MNPSNGHSQSRNTDWIGPEYGFGWAVGDHFKQPVLIVKVAWGGKSLNVDFRPPGAVAARGGEVGPYYTGMLDYVADVLGNLGTEFPEWKGKGYRIADPKKHPAFKGNVIATDTRPFLRDASKSPSNFGYHWNHNAESTYLNGQAMGRGMLKLIAP